jgi:hypothetical protein
MTPGNWITLAIAVLGIAATWGALQYRIMRAEKDIEKLQAKDDEYDRGRERQGERIGALEVHLAQVEARAPSPAPAPAGAVRRPTRNPAQGGGGGG